MPFVSEANQVFTGLTMVTLLFLMAAAILILDNRTVGRQARTIFLTCVTALAFFAAADWFNYVFGAALPSLRPFHVVSMAITFALAPALPVAIAYTIFPNRGSRWIAVLLALHAMVELATIVGGFVFYVDEANVYHRGAWYMVYMVVYGIASVHLVVESIHAGRTYQSSNVVAMLAILAVLGVGVGIQIANSNVRTSWPAVSMAVILYFMSYSEMVLRTDALTKLLNRHSYDEELSAPPLPCTVVVIDVNDFKHVNDTYGHAYGDVCLATIARLILRVFGSSGRCFRTGGDEFVVIITKGTSKVEALANKLEEGLDRERAKDERLPTVSWGACEAECGCADFAEIVSIADKRMYEAKRARGIRRRS